MPKITCKSDEGYYSHDPGDGDRPIHLEKGDSCEVSAEKAAQIEADFDAKFLTVGG